MRLVFDYQRLHNVIVIKGYDVVCLVWKMQLKTCFEVKFDHLLIFFDHYDEMLVIIDFNF